MVFVAVVIGGRVGAAVLISLRLSRFAEFPDDFLRFLMRENRASLLADNQFRPVLPGDVIVTAVRGSCGVGVRLPRNQLRAFLPGDKRALRVSGSVRVGWIGCSGDLVHFDVDRDGVRRKRGGHAFCDGFRRRRSFSLPASDSLNVTVDSGLRRLRRFAFQFHAFSDSLVHTGFNLGQFRVKVNLQFRDGRRRFVFFSLNFSQSSRQCYNGLLMSVFQIAHNALSQSSGLLVARLNTGHERFPVFLRNPQILIGNGF